MKDDAAVWYLPDDSGQPAGPYITATVLSRLQSQQCDRTTLCWREGMPEWQPLAKVEPFRSELGGPERWPGWRTLGLVAVVLVLCGAGVVGYCLLARGRAGFLSSNRKRDEQAVRQLEAECLEIFYGNSRPLTDFNKILSEDYMFVNMLDGTVVYGKKKGLNVLRGSQDQIRRAYRSCKPSDRIQSIRFLSDLAIVDKKQLFEAITVDGRQISQELWHTNIWRKTRGGWHLAHTTWYGEPSAHP
jgi:ketosteroid isomerase-like protein